MRNSPLKKWLKYFFNHNRYEAITCLIVLCILFWVFGCESKVESIVNPDRKVTRIELSDEVENYLAMADVRFARLDQQDELRDLLFRHGITYASTGAIDPIGLLTALGSLFGAGAIADNVRQRRNHRRDLTNYVDSQKNNKPSS